MRFATLYIESSDHTFTGNVTLEITLCSLNQILLCRTGNNQNIKPKGAHLTEHLKRSGHHLHLRKIFEQSGLMVVNLPNLIGFGRTAAVAHTYTRNGLLARNPFIQIDITLGHSHIVMLHSLIPGFRVVGHRIIQNAVHVKHDDFFSFQCKFHINKSSFESGKNRL
jgi:hypothetical protein